MDSFWVTEHIYTFNFLDCSDFDTWSLLSEITQPQQQQQSSQHCQGEYYYQQILNSLSTQWYLFQ